PQGTARKHPEHKPGELRHDVGDDGCTWEDPKAPHGERDRGVHVPSEILPGLLRISPARIGTKHAPMISSCTWGFIPRAGIASGTGEGPTTQRTTVITPKSSPNVRRPSSALCAAIVAGVAASRAWPRESGTLVDSEVSAISGPCCRWKSESARGAHRPTRP